MLRPKKNTLKMCIRDRYKCLRNAFKGVNNKNISHLIEMGVYLQVNVTSVFGSEHKFVSKLIDNDYLHLIALSLIHIWDMDL